MKIRAITLGVPMSELGSVKGKLKNIADLREEFNNNSIDVQTVRFCSSPYTADTEYNENFFHQVPEILDNIDSLVKEKLLEYYSFLPGLCDQVTQLSPTQRKVIRELPQYLDQHPVMFSSVQASSVRNGISFEVIKECASLIKNLALKDPFMNLQFATTFNMPPNTPFFPSAYHHGEDTKISIALEAADEVVNITQEFTNGKHSFKWLEERIVRRFTDIYDKIADIIDPFCEKFGFSYSGMDFSPAQYPEIDKSIGTAIENIKLSHFGEVGTVFAIGFLTSVLKKVQRPKIGFSGFMQPLLEDFTIAKRHSEKKFNLTQMLLNSTVCGLGLDCIPLPGNISEETLTLLMMDVAMLSTRLNKPLTCRLMPILGKDSEDVTEFDFEYFTNSKICSIEPSSQSTHIWEFIKRNPGYLI